MTDREPPRAPGWYRVTKDGWEYVAGLEVPVQELPGDTPVTELVLVETNLKEVPLW